MNTSRTFTIFILGAMFLLLPAHGMILADQLIGSNFSVGSVTTDGGSWLNLGESVIGRAQSDTHIMYAGGIPVMMQLSTPPLWGDIDDDGDVDADDYSIFAACMKGPFVSYSPVRECTQTQFDLADVQHDNDVDLGDYQFLNLSFVGQ